MSSWNTRALPFYISIIRKDLSCRLLFSRAIPTRIRTVSAEIDGARIMFPNFSGAPDAFNKQGGKRYFTVKIDDQEIADALLAEGWNVKIKAPREERASRFVYES